jgi:hypothetical protein
MRYFPSALRPRCRDSLRPSDVSYTALGRGGFETRIGHRPDWVTLGDPPAGNTIDLHFSLKPYHENALIDALNEVSNPIHRKHVYF